MSNPQWLIKNKPFPFMFLHAPASHWVRGRGSPCGIGHCSLVSCIIHQSIQDLLLWLNAQTTQTTTEVAPTAFKNNSFHPFLFRLLYPLVRFVFQLTSGALRWVGFFCLLAGACWVPVLLWPSAPVLRDVSAGVLQIRSVPTKGAEVLREGYSPRKWNRSPDKRAVW